MVKVVVVPGRNSLILRMLYAVLGTTAGVMVAAAFTHYKNVHVIFWGFFSALWATAALLLHVSYKRGKLAMYVNHLKTVIIFGIIGQIIGASALIVYLVLGGVFHDKLQDFSRSYFVASVWGFMTWKWAFVLYWYGRQYRHIVLEEALIPVGGEETIYVDADQRSIVKAPEMVA